MVAPSDFPDDDPETRYVPQRTWHSDARPAHYPSAEKLSSDVPKKFRDERGLSFPRFRASR
jgi:hypothetical protein